MYTHLSYYSGHDCNVIYVKFAELSVNLVLKYKYMKESR